MTAKQRRDAGPQTLGIDEAGRGAVLGPLVIAGCVLDPDTAVRPFIAGSAGVCRNRTEGYWKTWEKAFDASVNTLGLGLRAGLLIGGFEFSAVYNVNRYDTWRFFNTGYEESYVWDNLVLRVGWIIPFKK